VDRVKALEARDEMIRRVAVKEHLQQRAEDHARREVALHEKALEAREKAMQQTIRMLEYPLLEQRVMEEDEDGNPRTLVFLPASWSKATAGTMYRLAMGDSKPIEEPDPANLVDFSNLTDEQVFALRDLFVAARTQKPQQGPSEIP